MCECVCVCVCVCVFGSVWRGDFVYMYVCTSAEARRLRHDARTRRAVQSNGKEKEKDRHLLKGQNAFEVRLNPIACGSLFVRAGVGVCVVMFCLARAA